MKFPQKGDVICAHSFLPLDSIVIPLHRHMCIYHYLRCKSKLYSSLSYTYKLQLKMK